ncbi:MAG: YqeG family HAD IIIA-type phosphatase, partial [Gemmiger formicilis]|uniref:YqeG family HAD IIIA-type phosphatase n=1 Tax=Gemmiger formicilis TaxID=745368 RepID=UPI003993630C
LTHNDITVPDAAAVFARCQHTRARYWGFKEEGLPFAEMQALFAQMKACGKTTCLEVVAYTEPECLHGAEMAAACGCDILMGTVYSDAVHAYCRAHGLRYMPFVGQISGRPSILHGTPAEMICEAEGYLAKGVDGIDLLGYRYTSAAAVMNQTFIAAVQRRSAGGIGQLAVDEIKLPAACSTIGSAFLRRFCGISPTRSTPSATMWRPRSRRWYPTACLAYLPSTMKARGLQRLLTPVGPHDDHAGVDALFRHIHSLGLKTLLLSDNSAVRIERFNRNIRTLFIAEAGKPDPAAYRRACAMLGLPPEQVVCVGDQVFRDIRGANSAGLDSILVDFIRLPGETHYGKKRVLEKAILWFYHRDPRRRGRLDGIGK